MKLLPFIFTLLSCCLGACSVTYPPNHSQDFSAEILDPSINEGPSRTVGNHFYVVVQENVLSEKNSKNNCHWDPLEFQKQAKKTNASADHTKSSEYQAYLACLGRASQQQARDYLQKIAVVAVRSELITQKIGQVQYITSQRATDPLYRILVDVTELEANVEGGKSSEDNVQRQIGWGLGAATPYVVTAFPLIGPLGGLLNGFDVITGIPIKWQSAKKVGKLTIEISLVDARSNEVIFSIPADATFTAQARRLGDSSIGSHSVHILGSYAEEAVFVAAREGVKELASQLKKHSS